MKIEYKIYLKENFARGNYDLFLVKETPQGRYLVRINDKNEEIEEKMEDYVMSNSFRPSLSLQRELLSQLLEQITNLGIKLPDESKTQGQLEAQTKHLQDLRQLLKLKD